MYNYEKCKYDFSISKLVFSHWKSPKRGFRFVASIVFCDIFGLRILLLCFCANSIQVNCLVTEMIYPVSISIYWRKKVIIHSSFQLKDTKRSRLWPILHRGVFVTLIFPFASNGCLLLITVTENPQQLPYSWSMESITTFTLIFNLLKCP